LREVEAEAQEYLDREFTGQKMVVIGSYKFIGSRHFDIKAYPEDNEDLVFRITVDNTPERTNWRNDYWGALLAYLLKKDIDTLVKHEFGAESKAYVELNTRIVEAEKVSDLTDSSSLDEAVAKIDMLHISYIISIFPNEECKDIVRESEKVKKVIDFCNDRSLKPSLLDFTYFNTHRKITLMFTFYPDEYQNIADPEEIRQKIREGVRHEEVRDPLSPERFVGAQHAFLRGRRRYRVRLRPRLAPRIHEGRRRA
jgi:hypothetical protein